MPLTAPAKEMSNVNVSDFMKRAIKLEEEKAEFMENWKAEMKDLKDDAKRSGVEMKPFGVP